MIEAHIYFNDVCVSVKRLDVDYPPDHIRELSTEPLNALGNWDEIPIDTVIRRNIWIYNRSRKPIKDQTHPRQFRYDFCAGQSDINFAKPMGRSLDIGFESEPTPEVNLDKLAAKMRDNLKIKELLIKYYNS